VSKDPITKERTFSGNIYFFCSFDVGDDIDLKLVHNNHVFARTGTFQSQYFKSYHRPLVLDINQCKVSETCESAKLYNFGVISLRYRFPFSAPLEDLRRLIHNFENVCEHKSVEDARSIFSSIRSEIRQPRFFHLSKSYALIQIKRQAQFSPAALKEQFGHEIASALRFEKERLSEYKKNEILSGMVGYYRGDLLIIDHDSALTYDDDYSDLLDIFEFANMRHMELQYFDRLLDKQLNVVYERQPYKIPLKAYFPLWGMLTFDPIGELAKLRVDISVVSERLWSSIKFSEEPYYLEVYKMLSEKLDFSTWQASIDKKMDVIRDILEVYEHKVAAIRYDMLNILIAILIFIELVIAFLGYIAK